VTLIPIKPTALPEVDVLVAQLDGAAGNAC
jgi:hypothetical protein